VVNIKKIIKEEMEDFDWVKDIKPSLTVYEIKTGYSNGFKEFFEAGDTIYLSGILMLETGQGTNNDNHIILNNIKVVVKSVKIKTMNIIPPPEITTSTPWLEYIGSVVSDLNLGGISEDDGISIVITKNMNESEEDDFDWIRDTNLSIKSVEDIKYNLNKPFKLYDAKTGKEDSDYATVVNGIYWIEENEKSPMRYNVCWNGRFDKEKICSDHDSKHIVNYFDEERDNIWLWKFIDLH
jgi:hypothetical protein